MQSMTINQELANSGIKLLIIVGIFLNVYAAWAGSVMTVQNSTGTSIGRIDSDGTVYTSSGSIVGRIKSDGTVYNSTGNSIGSVKSNGTIYNKSGSIVGRVASDGMLQNSSGAGIGRIDGSTVRNSAGSKKGSFIGGSSSDRLTIAAYLFLFDPSLLK